MTTMKTSYINALLSDACYVHALSPNDTIDQLKGKLTPSMTPALAEFIGNNFSVEAQTPEYASGFSATVWVGKGDYAGQVYVSMRGTEPGWPDFTADGQLATTGIAYHQLEDMVNWWLRETTSSYGMAKQIHFAPIIGEYGIEGYELEEAAEVQGTGNLLIFAGSITGVNGHSLGGYLATAFARLFGNQASPMDINTFNSVGYSRPKAAYIETIFNQIAQIIGPELGLGSFSVAQNNFYAENGINVTTNTWDPVGFQQYGQRISLYQEYLLGPINNHSMYKLTDLLALADALAQLDPTFNELVQRNGKLELAKLNDVIRAGSAQMSASYETVLDALRKLLLGVQVTPTPVGDAGGGDDSQPVSRQTYHENLSQLLQEQAVKDLAGKATFVSLVDQSAASLAAAASNPNALATRYALRELTSFAVLGADYGQHNQNGELDLYNPSTGLGSMSEQYLTDRSAMLTGVIRARMSDTGSGNVLIDGGTAGAVLISYKDIASGLTLNSGATGADPRYFMFGSQKGETIKGGYLADHLYGMGGNDILTGNQGNDYLEGGKGSDTLEGGKGDDILIGGEGIDTYVINTGDGHDTIIDDGRNILVIDGKTFAGVFVKQEGSNSYVFTSDDATYTMTFNSPGTLTLDGSTSINFLNQTSAADFADGDFGIRLQEAPPETNRVLTGTAYRDEMSIFETGADQANWELQFTSFPDLNPNTPFYQQPLTAVAPRLQVTGGDSGDYLFGFARHDEIAGGAGDDIIQGNITSWNNKLLTLSGNLEGDLLDGGSGNDWVGGSGGADQISGSDGDDLLSGYNDVDSISGDQGNDILVGGSHADVLTGGIGDDILSGDGYFTGSLNLTLDNLGSLSIQKTASSDGYYTAFTTTNYAIRHDAPNSGDDILLGGAGRDMLFGGNGADILDGGTESDSLFGGDGDDYLHGGDGNDWHYITGSGSVFLGRMKNSESHLRIELGKLYQEFLQRDRQGCGRFCGPGQGRHQ